MIDHKEIQKTAAQYGKNVTIATLGGHSALDVCRGAKDEGFKTIVVAKRGRERTYTEHYKTEGKRGIVDDVIVVENFSDLTSEHVQKELLKKNALFVNSRYFWVYCNIDEIENNFRVPILGSRSLVRKEERDEEKNQYFLLEEAGIRTPKRFSNPKDIDRLALVKVAEAARHYERAYFFVKDGKDFEKKSKQWIENMLITKEALDRAVIEEVITGAHVNFNFYYSPLNKKIELLGTDIRRQTNVDGLLRLTAEEQLEILKHQRVQYVETGHQAITIKESLIEKAYDAAEKFIAATQKHYPPGILGAFALQGAIIPGPPAEELVVFDVSMRIPGSPGTRYTPYGHYMYGEDISVGRRIAMEVKEALKKNKLGEIVT